MPAGTERRPQVPGDRPDVGAGRAGHVHVQVDQPVTGAAERLQLQPRHRHPAGRQLQLLPRPDSLVGAAAVHLDRADRARHLVDLAGEGRQPGADLRLGQVIGGDGFDHLPFGVVGDGPLPQADGGGVPLAGLTDVTQQSRGPADADHQHAGGHRIEGAAVPHPPDAGQLPDPGHHVVRGHPARLVHHQQPVPGPARRRAVAHLVPPCPVRSVPSPHRLAQTGWPAGRAVRVRRRWRQRLDTLVDRTPPERDRYVDLLRVVAIGVVVVWHWSLSVLYYSESAGRWVMPNPIHAVPGAWAATWLLQIVPVFFLVGGYANLAAWQAARRSGVGLTGYYRSRLRRLLVPVLVFLAVWVGIDLLGLAVVPGYPGVLRYGVILLTPLWFIAAYLWVVLLVPLTAAGHARARWLTVGALAVAVIACDVGRFAADLSVLGW